MATMSDDAGPASLGPSSSSRSRSILIGSKNGYASFLSTHTSSPIIAGTDPGVETNSGPFVMGTGTVGAVTIDNGIHHERPVVGQKVFAA